MKRFKLTLEYDGTNFAGYQVQPAKRTVQGELEGALEKIYKQKVLTYASGRTDAGVHALGAVVHFDAPKTIKNNILDAMNSYLPEDLKVVKVEEVDQNFDARFMAKKKTYGYKFYLSRYERPLFQNRALRVNDNIDIEKMREACKYLIGKHDFTSFVARKSGKTDFVREIYDANIEKLGDGCFMFKISGNGFLYNMVRIIMGTLLFVGSGKFQPVDVQKIIDNKDRRLAGKTVPPYGLYLLSVEYV